MGQNFRSQIATVIEDRWGSEVERLVDVRKSRSLKPLMPAVGVPAFHCVSYRETDTVQEHGSGAALRHESGICADLTVNESFCWLSKLCHVLLE